MLNNTQKSAIISSIATLANEVNDAFSNAGSPPKAPLSEREPVRYLNLLIQYFVVLLPQEEDREAYKAILEKFAKNAPGHDELLNLYEIYWAEGNGYQKLNLQNSGSKPEPNIVKAFTEALLEPLITTLKNVEKILENATNSPDYLQYLKKDIYPKVHAAFDHLYNVQAEELPSPAPLSDKIATQKFGLGR